MTRNIRHEPHPLALLSHELRTPLNAVLGYADAMRVEAFGPLPAPYKEQAGVIHAAASHLLAVVDAMTAVGATGDRPLALDPLGRSDLEKLLSDATELLAPRARSLNLELRVAPAGPGAVQIRADRVALTQVLVNLIDNALKFTAPGGTITLGLGRADGDVLLTVESGGGAGTPAGASGPGLGLRLAQVLVEAMEGRLALDLSTGGAARAAVRLPAITAP